VAADALSRARDDLRARERCTVVSIYAFEQMAKGIEATIKAYKIALANSIECNANLQELFAHTESLAKLMTDFELFPDVIEPFEPLNPENTGE
jgi:hypothetical protein